MLNGGGSELLSLADTLGLVPLPAMYGLLLGGMLLSYMVLTQIVKTWFNKKFEE